MVYNRLFLPNGTVLTEEHFRHFENGIYDVSYKVEQHMFTLPSLKGYIPVSEDRGNLSIVLTSVEGLEVDKYIAKYVTDGEKPYWVSRKIKEVKRYEPIKVASKTVAQPRSVLETWANSDIMHWTNVGNHEELYLDDTVAIKGIITDEGNKECYIIGVYSELSTIYGAIKTSKMKLVESLDEVELNTVSAPSYEPIITSAPRKYWESFLVEGEMPNCTPAVKGWQEVLANFTNKRVYFSGAISDENNTPCYIVGTLDGGFMHPTEDHAQLIIKDCQLVSGGAIKINARFSDASIKSLNNSSSLKDGILVYEDGTIGTIDASTEGIELKQSFDIGDDNIAGLLANVFGYHNKSTGIGSNTFGSENDNTGYMSSCRGSDNLVVGKVSDVSGFNNKVYGSVVHCEGNSNEIYNNNGHVEGELNVVKGRSSHAQGRGTIASGDYQDVFGTYNIEDTENKYLQIAGNGDIETKTRSNAYTLDKRGNAWFAGEVTAVNGIVIVDQVTEKPFRLYISNGQLMINEVEVSE